MLFRSQFQDTSSHKAELLHQGWFSALLPVLASPFAVAGAAFAGVFQRLRAHIGPLYGADLIGGALAAVLFLPALGVLAGPDVVFVVTAVAGIGALAAFGRDRVGTVVAGGMTALGVGLALVGLRGDVLRVHHTVGFTEEDVTWTEWTPLVRLAVHETERQTNILLDNTSASEVARHPEDLVRFEKQGNRGFVYQVVEPGGKAAILAASAGPEVAVARAAGFTDIEEIGRAHV